MRRVCIVVAALVLAGVAPLIAAENAYVVSTPRLVPASGGQAAGALATAIIASVPDPNFKGFGGPGVPCFNCVPTSGTTNVGLPVPLAWLSAGSSIVIVLNVDIATYSGTGAFIFSLRQGSRTGKVVARGQVTTSVYPSQWMAYFPSTAPITPGQYTLDGIFDAGGATSTVNTPIIIQ
jgi:hypothetical protein